MEESGSLRDTEDAAAIAHLQPGHRGPGRHPGEDLRSDDSGGSGWRRAAAPPRDRGGAGGSRDRMASPTLQSRRLTITWADFSATWSAAGAARA